jgi:hypothetical protein
VANRIRIITEKLDPELHRLGRHVEHDERSKMFRVAQSAAPIASVTFKRHCPPFDQLKLGSCTGNAMAGLLMTDPFWLAGRILNEDDAVKLYKLATTLDNIPGAYPPDDTGSSGIGVAKAAEQEGWFQSYEHALGIADLLSALSQRPGVLGLNWYTSFDNPRPTGECALTPSATVRGGHEVQMFKIDALLKQVWCYQSWGPKWGGLRNGTFWLSFKTLTRLLAEQGDATFPVVPAHPANVGKLH